MISVVVGSDKKVSFECIFSAMQTNADTNAASVKKHTSPKVSIVFLKFLNQLDVHVKPHYLNGFKQRDVHTLMSLFDEMHTMIAFRYEIVDIKFKTVF